MAALAISLSAGIALARQLPMGWPTALAAMAILLLTAASMHKAGLRRCALAALCLCWMAAGALLLALQQPAPLPTGGTLRQARLSICSPPKETARSMRYEARLLALDGCNDCSQRVMLYLPKELPQPTMRQQIEASVEINKPSILPNGFDYRRYLAKKNIHYLLRAQATTATEQHLSPADRLLAKAQQLRNHLAATIRSLDLTPSAMGTAEALLLGWKADLDDGVHSRYRDAGIAHLLCVSGLHVGILAAMLGWLFSWMGNGPWGRRLRGAIVLAGVWGFVLVTGCAPATLRAGILFSCFVAKDCLLLRGNSLNTLGAAAAAMLCCDPSLLWDVGFELSFAAVLGIIAFYRPLYNLLPWPDELLLERRIDAYPLLRRLTVMAPLRGAQWIFGLLCITTAATLGTLPLTLYYFHQFPLYFVAANMTVVPMAGVLLLTTMASLAIPSAAAWIEWELGIADAITTAITQWPHAVLHVEGFGLAKGAICTLILIAIAFTIRKIHD